MKMIGYWVYTHTTPDGMVYVGMSGQKDTSQRWKKSLYYRYSLMKNEIDKWGWENITHSVVKDSLTKQEAQQLEEEIRQFNEANGVSLNKIKSGGITKDIKEYEKNRNNSLERIEYKREWQKNHREEHNRQCRESYYRKKNKERVD